MGPTPAESLKIVAHIRAKSGKRDELEKAVLGLIEPTRAEEGCQEYELFVSTEDENQFTFIETWTTPDALEQHLQTPPLQAFFARVGELLDGEPQILKLKLVR